MLSFVMNGGKASVDPSILEIVSELDPENKEDGTFRNMKKAAKEELHHILRKCGKNKEKGDVEEEAEQTAAEPKDSNKESEARKFEEARRKAETERAARKEEAGKRLTGLTPANLKRYLPKEGDEPGISIEYHPIQNFFRVRYPSILLRINSNWEHLKINLEPGLICQPP